jgi:hypothetical protein
MADYIRDLRLVKWASIQICTAKILNGPYPLWVVLQFRARAGFDYCRSQALQCEPIEGRPFDRFERCKRAGGGSPYTTASRFSYLN